METYLNEMVRYLAAQSWQVAVLTVAVAVATLALRSRSAHVRYLLWLIVVAKCLVPPLHAVPLRVLPSPPATRAVLSIPSPGPRIEEHSTFSNPPLPHPSRPLFQEAAAPAPAPQPHVQAHRLSSSGWLGVLWLAGAGAYLAMNLLRALRGHCWLRRARRPLPEDLQAGTANSMHAYGVRRHPNIWIVDGVGQPFVWGLLRGSIYVPPAFLTIGNPEYRRDILAHELSHIVRLDAAVNALQILAQGLFWFQPFVWWANRKIRQEREKCCDEMVIARLHTAPKDYSTAILETLTRAREPGRPVPSLAVASPLRHIEERIRTMLRPGKSFYGRPSLAAAMIAVLIALLAVPTAVVLTAQARTGDKVMDLNDVMTKYEAAREAAPSRYLMVIKNERDLYITYRDGDRLFRAKYDFSGPVYAGRRIDLEAMAQERARAGDTIASMLAWANTQAPQNAEVYDGVQGYSLWSDGYGHLRSGRAARPGTGGFDYLSLPTLPRYGWPDLGPARSTRRLVPDDTYALANDLLCIEEQHQVTDRRRGQVTEATRFYLNPARDYICQRRHEALQDHDYAEEVARYGRTAGGQWYPLQIDEFGYRHSVQPLTTTPTAVNVLSLDTNPTFPEDIFKPDALLTRYAAQIVPDQATRPPVRGAKPNASQVRVAGRALAGETQQPIAGALVRVAVPAADMRFARVPTKQITQENGTKSDLYETKTDANGQFELLIPRTGGADAFSVDAMAPGYGTAAGTFHAGGDHPHLARLSFDGPLAGTASDLTILLPHTAYIAGTVRDSTGAPAAGVQVFGQMTSTVGSYGIARTQTDARGRFEMFDFPLRKESDEKAQLMFQSPIAVPVTLSNIYELSTEKRASLEVTLPRGFKITGVLLDAEGRPAPGVLVEAVDGFPIKDTTTDSNGRFELAGLRPGPYHLRAHAMDISQKVVQPIAYVPDGDQNVTLKMSHIEIKGPLRPVTLFGMQLVDVTPELRQVYDLGNPDAVMILDPGANHRRLNIGELRKGYCFWQIGDKSISSLKEMVAELLRQLAPSWTGQQGQLARPPRRVRVVYTKPASANTQYLVLTENDVAELKQVAEQLGIAPADSN